MRSAIYMGFLVSVCQGVLNLGNEHISTFKKKKITYLLFISFNTKNKKPCLIVIPCAKQRSISLQNVLFRILLQIIVACRPHNLESIVL